MKIILNDSITKYKRLDRAGYNFNDRFLADKIKSGEYSDYHCLRPYSQFKEVNDFIIQNLRRDPEQVKNNILKTILNIK